MPSRVQFNFNPTGVAPAGTGVLAGVLDITDRAQSKVVVQITGTFVATVQFEATVDGTNWIAIQGTNLNTGTAATNTTAPALFRIDTSALAKLRLNVTAWTSAASFAAVGIEVEG